MLRAIFSLGAITIISLALIPVQWLAVRREWPLRRRIPTFYHRIVCGILGIHITEIGRRIAEHPLLIVSNHTSWLDISVITAVAPVVFVAKSEVAGWPLFGTFARLQRTVFVERARRSVRAAARKASAQSAPPATHLVRATMSLRALRGSLTTALQRFEAIRTNESELDSIEFQTAMNLLKVGASEMATATVMSAMQACGLSGYRNDGEFSVARHVRDVLSSSIMINNERILANAAAPSLLVQIPGSIRS